MASAIFPYMIGNYVSLLNTNTQPKTPSSGLLSDY